jgi:alpha-tubulin suppressor-like RCC1 family protein
MTGRSLDHACGVATDGNAYCWGGNDQGELGTRSQAPSLAPMRVRLFAEN